MTISAIDRDAARRPAPSGTAARHAEETRRRLLEAGASIFARDGFHAAKVAAIARAAGVANGTFYLHFASKEEMATELARIATTDLARRVGEVHAAVTDPERANRAEIEALVDFVLANRSLAVALLANVDLDRAGLFDLLARQRETEIRAAQKVGSYTCAVDAVVASRAELSMLAGVLRWWAQTDFAIDRRVLVDSIGALRREGSRPGRAG